MTKVTLIRLMRMVLLGPLVICLSMGGGGGIGSKSVPKAPKAPAAPEPEPVPDLTAQDPETKAIRDEERKKLQNRRGAGGTVLTSPLGVVDGASAGGSSLLGRIGQP